LVVRAKLAFTDLSIGLCRAVLSIACAIAAPAFAHTLQPYECEAPSRPVDDQDDVLWQRFLVEIDEFQACVSADAESHQVASLAHQEAARSAVDSWNRFVKTNLNVPEDFPFDPDSNN
jgi:hypothetical protein